MSYIDFDAFDLDEYERHTRALQEFGAIAPPLPILPLPSAPTGLSSVSTLQKIDAEPAPAAPKQRPSLPKPREIDEHIMFKLLRAHAETEKLSKEAVDLFEVEVKKNQSDIRNLSTEKEGLLQKEAEAAKARATWSALSLVAQYIAGVSTIATGYAIGGAPGLAIAAAGVIGVGNRVIQDTHLLDIAVEYYTKSEELQQKLKTEIGMNLLFLQLGLGLAGGAAAWHAGTLAAAHLNGAFLGEKGLEILTGASTVSSLSSQVGTSYYERKLAHLQAKVRDIETQNTLKNQAIFNETAEVSKILKNQEEEIKTLQKAIIRVDISPD